MLESHNNRVGLDSTSLKELTRGQKNVTVISVQELCYKETLIIPYSVMEFFWLSSPLKQNDIKLSLSFRLEYSFHMFTPSYQLGLHFTFQ